MTLVERAGKVVVRRATEGAQANGSGRSIGMVLFIVFLGNAVVKSGNVWKKGRLYARCLNLFVLAFLSSKLRDALTFSINSIT